MELSPKKLGLNAPTQPGTTAPSSSFIDPRNLRHPDPEIPGFVNLPQPHQNEPRDLP